MRPVPVHPQNGDQDSFCQVLSHGWLAVGDPALRDRHYRGSDFAQCAYPSAYAGYYATTPKQA
jgi:hypothetical protein